MKKLMLATLLYLNFCFLADATDAIKPAESAEPVTVAAGIFLGIINEQKTAPYQRILQEAAKRANIDIVERVFPLKRAVTMFAGKSHVAIYGMTDQVIPIVGADNIITSYPLGAYKLYLFTKKGEKPISSFKQLQGKTVGGVLGYESYYSSLKEHQIRIDYIGNEADQFKKLTAGRIEVIVGFLPDWLPFLETLSYDANFPIHVGYDYMTVWNTPQGRYFVNKISPVLQGMKQDGTLESLLGERFMAFDYQPTEKYEWRPEPEPEPEPQLQP